MGHVGDLDEGATGARVDVSARLDALDSRGPFFRWHLARMCFAWSSLSLLQEATPYMFPSLREELGLSVGDLGAFASAFHLGCVAGALLAARLLDASGRHSAAIASVAVTVVCSVLLATAASTFAAVMVLRVLQSCAWSVLITALQAWYSEFLPTKGRGALLATYSVGWPFGRAVAIVASRAGLEWRALTWLMAAMLTGVGLLLRGETESPRFLAQRGAHAEARTVLVRVYAANGQAWQEHTALQDAASSKQAAFDKAESLSLRQRMRLLVTEYRVLTGYSTALFAVLSASTVLIDTWGPGLFQRLLYPDDGTLPHAVLLLFSVGDLCGILASITLVDRIGRKGSFYVGFGLQAALFLAIAASAGALAWAPQMRTRVVVLVGFVAQGTRCFGWEAAHMWTLEAFPTAVRATAVAVTAALMRLAAVGTVSASAEAANDAPPGQCLAVLAAVLCIGLTVARTLPKETANAPMVERGARPGPEKGGGM